MSSAALPVSMLSSLPPTSLLPPSLFPPPATQSTPDTTTSAAATVSIHSSLTAPASVSASTASVSSSSSIAPTLPASTPPASICQPVAAQGVSTGSPSSPTRASVAAKPVSDAPAGKAASVIPINDATVSAAAMLMSIASTTGEQSSSTAGSSQSAPTTATAPAATTLPTAVPLSAPSLPSATVLSTASASPLSPAPASASLSFSLSSPVTKGPASSSAFISSASPFSSLLSPRSPYHSFSPSPFLPTSLASPTLSSSSLFSTSSSLFSSSFSSLPSLSSTIPSPLIASIRPGPLTPAATSSLVSSMSHPAPKAKPAQPLSALDRFVNYLHPLLTTHPGSLAPSITLPQLRVLAANNFHQLIALAVSVHFNPRRPYAGHRGKEEKLIICRNGWNALRNFISAEREKAWRAEMSGLSVREQRAYKKKRREDRKGEGETYHKVANAAIREGRMAKFIDIANEYSINYSAYVKLGDEHSGRLRFRQMKAEQKDAAANALVNSSALISQSNVNQAISSAMPQQSPMMAAALPTTLAAVVNEQPRLLAQPLTPTTATSPAVAASVPLNIGSASFATPTSAQADASMSANSATNGIGSSGSSSHSSSAPSFASGSGSGEVKRRLDVDGAEGSDSSKRTRIDRDASGMPTLPLLPTDDELGGLALLSPKLDGVTTPSSVCMEAM